MGICLPAVSRPGMPVGWQSVMKRKITVMIWSASSVPAWLRDAGSLLLRGLALTFVCAIGFAAWLYFSFGSTGASVAYLRGMSVAIEPTSHHLGEIPAGRTSAAEFVVQNLTRKPVTILGARSSCQCTVVNDLPLTLAARERRSLRISVRPDERFIRKPFVQGARLFVDSQDSLPEIIITAEVVAPATVGLVAH